MRSLAVHSFGCADAPAQPARLGLKLAPATLGTSLSLQQHLRIERQGRVDELDAALEIDAERLDMVGLALGQRILALHFDGRSLESWRHPLVPEQLRGEDVLEDLQLTLWPIEVIRESLAGRLEHRRGWPSADFTAARSTGVGDRLQR